MIEKTRQITVSVDIKTKLISIQQYLHKKGVEASLADIVAESLRISERSGSKWAYYCGLSEEKQTKHKRRG